MSVPHTVSQNSPIETMKFLFKDIFFYMLYFQKEGLVEKELESDMRKSLLSVYGSLTSDGKPSETFEPKPFRKNMTFLESMGSIDSIPEFMTEKDFNFYLSEFEKNGMRGPINWYRNIDRNWEVTKNFHNKKIPSPTCFITGEDDPVGKWAPINPDYYDNLISSHIIKKAGHWVQQEKPDEVNKILLEFFK
jgi:pimeloyl-ACP methyl ester carboxylesterase